MTTGQKVLLLLSIIVIVVLLVLYRTGSWQKGIEGVPLDPTVKSTTKVVEQTELPIGLPDDLPLEKGIVLENSENQNNFYNSAWQPQSETQSIHKYLSKKTVEENAKIFEKYFADKKWKVTFNLKQDELSSLNTPKIKMYMAKKEGFEGLLKVVITENASTKDVYVEVSVTK